VQNLDATDLPEGSQLDVWLSESKDGPPVENALVGRRTVSAIGAGASSQRIFGEVEAPRVLPPGGYFVVWEVTPPPGISDVEERNNRDSRPITVAACSPQTRYRDVSDDSWGAAEIERWFARGVSTGCRTNTDPFLDRPFCPDQLLTREVVPIFMLRHLYGGDYSPSNGEDFYVDFHEFNGTRGLWADELARMGFLLESDSCSPIDGQPAFCPNLGVRRGELLLYLAQTLAWELTPVQGDTFIDVQADTPINRAIEAAARNGFLADDDPYCPSRGDGQAFCPDEPARRAFAAVAMVRAFAAAPQYPAVD